MRFPVSFAQQRVWLLDQGAPLHLAYRIWLDGPVDPVALQRAMDVTVARHGVLRTSIVATGGVPEQIVADPVSVPIERVTLPDGGEPEAIAAQFAERPFDLAHGPLLRAVLIEVGTDRWLFVLVLHQIIGDDASMGILLAELSTVYRADLAGTSPGPAPLWMDYGDYAVWQRDRLRGEELTRQLDYWRERLRGPPQELALPTKRPAPAVRSVRAVRSGAAIGAATTRRLRELADGAGTNLFTALLTGYAVALGRYARQTDLVIATPVAGRIRVELEPVVGLFTNILPVRMSLAGDPTFVELLGGVRDAMAEALAHEELPFGTLVEELRGEHTQGHPPLTRVQFAHRSHPVPALDLDGVAARGCVLFTGTAQLDLTLFADTSDGDETDLLLDYRTDILEAPFANRLLRSVASVLDHAASAPRTRVAELPLLPPGERVSVPGGRPAVLVVRDPTCLTPLRPTAVPVCVTALSESPSTSSTSDFPPPCQEPRGSTADARQQDHAPLGGLDIRRSLLESTATVTDDAETVPMPALCDRAARLARVLAAHGVGPQTRVGGYLGRGIGMMTALLGVWWAGAGFVPLDPDFPLARLESMARLAGLRVVISDHGHAGLAGSVASGVTVIMVEQAAAEPLDPVPVPGDALGYIHFTSGSTGVDVGHRAVATQLAAARRDLGLGPGDRFVAASPAAFDLVLMELLLPPLCGADLVIATAGQTPEADRLRSLCDLHGLHDRVYIVDDRLVPVPVGAVGEVYVAGRGMAGGYHGQPGRTARSFRPDPWGAEPGARMSATGDLGRWRDGGGLELLGRTDDQVTINGFRFQCGEAEAALGRHIAVRQAAVISALRDGEPALVAYVVPRTRPKTDPLQALRPHLRTMLPEYMIPTLIVPMFALPRTRDGQLDRSALPAPQWVAQPAANQVPPRNPVEATMIQIWGELLHSTAPIGVHDSLLDLGAQSLAAIRFVAWIADTYGVNLPAHRVFATPTIAELAEAVTADPDFARTRDDDLAELSDQELEDLLRAATAARERRRATRGDRS